MFKPRDRYDEVFEIEVAGWCYGLEHYPSGVTKELAYAVIKELAPSFRKAIESFFAFDLISVADRFAKSSQGAINVNEAALCILSLLPNPTTLEANCVGVLGEIIESAESVIPGVGEKLQSKWNRENHVRQQRAKLRSAA
ncbi:MAG TPA: hypothetical protein PKD37_06415 [Oligoflexia bacterium]|nr:hypothetical protein [Oligoflexia bacterium]HMP27594.1 hypothetical protein [Oligoflexia bacterium]